MTFDKNFCSSPWFHMRIENNGDYNFCRYSHQKSNSKITFNPKNNIKNQSVEFYFQNELSGIRKNLLDNVTVDDCRHCNKMQEHNKISGRERQLLKTGINYSNFKKTFLSSPWQPTFKKSFQTDGHTDQVPQDWQIDLGNYCNSACVFCFPHFSSRIANEHLKLGLIDQLPDPNWTADPDSFNRFLQHLQDNNYALAYLHFIGGETVITPAFKTILEKLLEYGLSQTLSIGLTTNLTVWRQDIFDLLTNFKVNLGLSIECLHPANEYIRYGSNYKDTEKILEKWVSESKKQSSWTTTIRTTPTLLSVLHLDTVYDYSLQNQILVESCNFLDRPEILRMSVLPENYRSSALEKINNVLDRYKNQNQQQKIVNIKHKDTVRSQTLQDLESYKNYLVNEEYEEFRLPDTVKYLKQLESIRNNRVLDYLPEYDKLFRSAGY